MHVPEAWGKTVSHLLRQGQIRNPKTGRDVGDHPPITPMKAAPRDEFSKGWEAGTVRACASMSTCPVLRAKEKHDMCKKERLDQPSPFCAFI